MSYASQRRIWEVEYLGVGTVYRVHLRVDAACHFSNENNARYL